MSHPSILSCILRVGEAVRALTEIESRDSASQFEFMDQLAMSRDAVERSHALLKRLRAQDAT